MGDEKRARDQAAKDAALTQKAGAFDSKEHGGKGPKESTAPEPEDQEKVREARAFAKLEQERSACDYNAMSQLEKEAAEAAARFSASCGVLELFTVISAALSICCDQCTVSSER